MIAKDLFLEGTGDITISMCLHSHIVVSLFNHRPHHHHHHHHHHQHHHHHHHHHHLSRAMRQIENEEAKEKIIGREVVNLIVSIIVLHIFLFSPSLGI